jgi:hypothetical protein
MGGECGVPSGAARAYLRVEAAPAQAWTALCDTQGWLGGLDQPLRAGATVRLEPLAGAPVLLDVLDVVPERGMDLRWRPAGGPLARVRWRLSGTGSGTIVAVEDRVPGRGPQASQEAAAEWHLALLRLAARLQPVPVAGVAG